jgi:hypothetical protein
MLEADVLSVVMARMGTSTGVANITEELKNVLLDISSRADFLTADGETVTVADQAEYDQPAGLKRIYECYISGSGLLTKSTYRQFLEETTISGVVSAEPTKYAIRHGKMYLWPIPDAVYNVEVDHARYHPETFTDILFGPEFNEAIYEGVITALYQGQLFEKLRLAEKKVSEKDYSKVTAGTDDSETDTDADGTENDKTVSVDESTSGSETIDDDNTVLTYKFSKDFPEIKQHQESYEKEIEKLIANIDIDTETVLVEYRDI